MSDEKVLTKEIAEQFIADEDSVNLGEFTAIDDDAAEVIGKYNGEDELYLGELSSLSACAAKSLGENKSGWLDLAGIEELSDAAAEGLSKLEGLNANLKELSDAAAESLSKVEDLQLWDLSLLSDAAAESLSRVKGKLVLGGLSELTDAAAESLSRVKGELWLGHKWGNSLSELTDAAAESLSKCKANLLLCVATLSDEAAMHLGKKRGGLLLSNVGALSDAAADSISTAEGLAIGWSAIAEPALRALFHNPKIPKFLCEHYSVFTEDEARSDEIGDRQVVYDCFECETVGLSENTRQFLIDWEKCTIEVDWEDED